MAGSGKGGGSTGRGQGTDRSGGDSQPVIITGQDQHGGYRKPPGLIEAISEIQRYWFIESKGHEIPADFLTIKGAIQFTMIGVRSGICEGFMLAILIPLALTFTSAAMASELKLKQDWFFNCILYITAFGHIAVNTIICCFLGKYYIGNITRRASNCLMNGRSLALFFKGMIVFAVFHFSGKYFTPSVVSSLIHKTWFSPEIKQKIYSILMEMIVRFPEAGSIAFIAAILASAVPFITVYSQDFNRKRLIRNALNVLSRTPDITYAFQSLFSKKKFTWRNRSFKRLRQLIPVEKGEQSILLGVGHPIDKLQDIGFLPYPEGHRKGHMWVFGTTGTGKTRLLEAMVEQDIKHGNSVLVIDPKGDGDLFSKVVQVAAECDRMEDLMLLTPIFPDCSIKIDPLCHYFLPEEIVSHVISGIQSKEEFFVDVANEITLIVVNSLILFAKATGISPNLNFQKIKDRIGYIDLKNTREQLGTIPTDEARELIGSLDQVLTPPVDHFARVSASLRTTLSSLVTGNVGSIIGRVESNKFIDRLESGKPVILVVQTGAMLTRKTAHIVARVLISMIQSFVGRAFASGKRLEIPLCIYADEAANILYRGVEDLFSKARGANVWLHAFSQSISDLTSVLTHESHARRILDNCNTKIFMRVNDIETATYISDYAGEREDYSPIISHGGGLTVRQVKEPVIPVSTALNLKSREFYLFGYGGAFKGKCLTVPDARLNIKYPDSVDSSRLPSNITLPDTGVDAAYTDLPEIEVVNNTNSSPPMAGLDSVAFSEADMNQQGGLL